MAKLASVPAADAGDTKLQEISEHALELEAGLTALLDLLRNGPKAMDAENVMEAADHVTQALRERVLWVMEISNRQ